MVYKKRIVIDPNVMVGKPVVAGTRIPVDLILEKLAQNVDVEALLRDYPRLTKQDVQAVLRYARDRVLLNRAHEEIQHGQYTRITNKKGLRTYLDFLR